MQSKGQRFNSASKLQKAKDSEPGPGAYDAHTHKTIQTFLAAKREKMSRQNPGFGASTAAHTLPYELDIAADQKAFTNSGGGETLSLGSGGGAAGASFGRRPPSSKQQSGLE